MKEALSPALFRIFSAKAVSTCRHTRQHAGNPDIDRHDAHAAFRSISSLGQKARVGGRHVWLSPTTTERRSTLVRRLMVLRSWHGFVYGTVGHLRFCVALIREWNDYPAPTRGGAMGFPDRGRWSALPARAVQARRPGWYCGQTGGSPRSKYRYAAGDAP